MLQEQKQRCDDLSDDCRHRDDQLREQSLELTSTQALKDNLSLTVCRAMPSQCLLYYHEERDIMISVQNYAVLC